MGGWRRVVRTAAAVAVALVALPACGATSDAVPPVAGRPLRVVAAENFWGSIAAQVGGPAVQVRSIVDNPDADPHDYEPTAVDARAVATADLVLVNGIGYDTWAGKLAAANPAANRRVIDVGRLLGVPDDGNPHRWYAPEDVNRVADRIAADLAGLDPAHADAYRERRAAFGAEGLAGYTRVLTEIRQRFAGTPVGASESIVALVAPALGLDLVTPPSFLRAVSEGTDPTAADKAAADRQVSGKRIKVYVVNPQNSTPDVQAQVAAAGEAGIPVVSMTETMVPATATWQEWQTRQLVALRDALATATGR